MSTSQTPKPGSQPTPTPGPSPRAVPGPKPSPGPSANHAHRTETTPAPHRAGVKVPVTPESDPTQWGRIDEDGNTYVKTADGERLIGSWQAGTPAEGLAHYGARYHDVATEVVYLETRLETHPSEASHLKETATALQKSLDEAAIIGDIEALKTRLAYVIDNADSAGLRAQEEKQARLAEAIAKREALLQEVEEIAETATEWKIAGDRIDAILIEWRTIRGIDRKTDDALWKRYSRAREAFKRRRGAFFAERDRQKAAARKTKEELIAKAEELKTSTNWKETGDALHELMEQWKKAGRAQRDIDDKLWEQFRAARDYFYQARNANRSARDQEFEANAAAKESLLEQYDSLIDPATNLDAARRNLRELQEKWEEIGYVPKARKREFEEKIAALESRVTNAADAQWRRTDPEAQARANQFIAKVEEYTKSAEAAEAKGKTKEAEKLRALAAQWQEWADTAVQAVENR